MLEMPLKGSIVDMLDTKTSGRSRKPFSIVHHRCVRPTYVSTAFQVKEREVSLTPSKYPAKWDVVLSYRTFYETLRLFPPVSLLSLIFKFIWVLMYLCVGCDNTEEKCGRDDAGDYESGGRESRHSSSEGRRDNAAYSWITL